MFERWPVELLGPVPGPRVSSVPGAVQLIDLLILYIIWIQSKVPSTARCCSSMSSPTWSTHVRHGGGCAMKSQRSPVILKSSNSRLNSSFSCRPPISSTASRWPVSIWSTRVMGLSKGSSKWKIMCWLVRMLRHRKNSRTNSRLKKSKRRRTPRRLSTSTKLCWSPSDHTKTNWWAV